MLYAHQLRGLAWWGPWHLDIHHSPILAGLLVQVSYDLAI
jgi:hypothetical protein